MFFCFFLGHCIFFFFLQAHPRNFYWFIINFTDFFFFHFCLLWWVYGDQRQSWVIILVFHLFEAEFSLLFFHFIHQDHWLRNFCRLSYLQILCCQGALGYRCLYYKSGFFFQAGSHCVALVGLELTEICLPLVLISSLHVWLLHRFWGFKVRCSHLQGKHSYLLSCNDPFLQFADSAVRYSSALVLFFNTSIFHEPYSFQYSESCHLCYMGSTWPTWTFTIITSHSLIVFNICIVSILKSNDCFVLTEYWCFCFLLYLAIWD